MEKGFKKGGRWRDWLWEAAFVSSLMILEDGGTIAAFEEPWVWRIWLLVEREYLCLKDGEEENFGG